MSNPITLTVDDEPPVLNAVERDLRRQYGRDDRAEALETVRQLKLRNAPVS